LTLIEVVTAVRSMRTLSLGASQPHAHEAKR
jgi:hypothetical protein